MYKMGFIPTPSNHKKEKDILILENFRATNLICDLDENLSELSGDDDNIFPMNKQSSNIQGNFIRQRSIPHNLEYSQPRERDVHNRVTKQLLN